MRRQNKVLITVLAVLVVYLVLSIPGRSTTQTVGAGNTSFAWDQNQMWQSLEAGFRDARTAGCISVNPQVRKGLQEGRRHLTMLAGQEFDPSDPLFDSIETNLFGLGPLVAACPENLEQYSSLVTSLRDEVKLLSRSWEPHLRKLCCRRRMIHLLQS